MTTCASKSGSRQDTRCLTARPSSAAEPPARTKSEPQAPVTVWTTLSIPVSLMSGTSLRPLMPPAALHQAVNTFAALMSCGSLVKPTSVSTPTLIWLAVTPWSGAPVALPERQTFFRLPKSPGAVAAVDACEVVVPPAELLEPLRLHPAATRASAARAAMVLIWNFTGFPPQYGPWSSVLLSIEGNYLLFYKES